MYSVHTNRDYHGIADCTVYISIGLSWYCRLYSVHTIGTIVVLLEYSVHTNRDYHGIAKCTVYIPIGTIMVLLVYSVHNNRDYHGITSVQCTYQ